MPEVLPLPVNRVSDVVIVGAGLCGLALARMLAARGLDVHVIEARSRLGGRVLTQHCEATGQPVDLGATWFWPETEPRMTALLTTLGLASHPQYDPGDALWLTDPNHGPQRRLEPGGVHAGARRIQGGAAKLVEALAAALPPDSVRQGVAVSALCDRGLFIELLLATGIVLRARQVVLALPPRLTCETLQFDPPLPIVVRDALKDVPTWMAAQAKAVTTFAHPFWRAADQSGNAFVRHAQAVLGEVFDACEADVGAGCDHAGTSHAALGGFVALSATRRENFRRGLPMLIDSQLAQLFGPQAQDGHLHLQDWAEEEWSCSAIDRAVPPGQSQADPFLRQPLWAGRLFLGGSETAAHGAGHMEGALESADRIAHVLFRHGAAAHHASARLALYPAQPAGESRAAAVNAFAVRVQALCGKAPEHYRRHLARPLPGQPADLPTQRVLLATVDQVYSEALAYLDELLPALDAAASGAINGRHALTSILLLPFNGWNKGLLEAALGFNAASCALSGFAQDHQPDAGALRVITLDLAGAWREFAWELNARLLASAGEAACLS